MSSVTHDYTALNLFCGGKIRYDLSRPWVIGDFVYASNGFIAGRLPASDEMKQIKDGREKMPKADQIDWSHGDHEDWTPVTELVDDIRNYLRVEMTGRLSDSRYEETEDDDGVPIFTDPKEVTVDVGPVPVTRGALLLLTLLPECVVAPEPERERILFKWSGGGEGILMQRRKDRDHA